MKNKKTNNNNFALKNVECIRLYVISRPFTQLHTLYNYLAAMDFKN